VASQTGESIVRVPRCSVFGGQLHRPFGARDAPQDDRVFLYS